MVLSDSSIYKIGFYYYWIYEDKMVKTYLLAVAMLGAATVVMAGSAPATTSAPAAPAAASAPAATSIASRSTGFGDSGFSVGINAGYGMNSAKSDGRSFSKYNRPTLGAHLDYSHLMSNPVFVGGGLELNCSIGGKSKKGAAEASLEKNTSGAFIGRVGVVSGKVAFSVNGAILLTSYKTGGKGGNPSSLEDDVRVGFAPGIGLTFGVANNVSVGLNYRYEIYPKSGGAKPTRPRIDNHNVFVKLSYHIPRK
jgi:opacity protein-like surface antigen